MPELNWYWIQIIAIGVLLGQLLLVLVAAALYLAGSYLYRRWIAWSEPMPRGLGGGR